MKFVEKTARTQEEALEAALVELNASITDVDVQVLEEGSKGLFGLFGSRPYKIRVTLREDVSEEEDLDVQSLLGERKPAHAPKPQQPRQPKREPKPAPAPRETRTEEAPAAAAETERKAARHPEPVRRVNPERKPAEAAEEVKQEIPAVQEIEEETETEAAAGDEEAVVVKHKSRRRHRSRGKKKPENGTEAQQEEVPAVLPPKAPARPMEKPVVTMIEDEALEPGSKPACAKAFLEELTRLMGVEVTVAVGTDQEGNVFGYMNGDTSGILIGRRGETLDALQYLTSLRVNRGQESYTRVTLDTENYRAKREDTLTRLANRKANHAVKTGRKVALDPMNPYERRIIHSALQANDAVETHSEGEEPNRHVVITVRKA